MKDKIANILKEYTNKNGISASFVILEDYAEELVKNGAELVVKCKDCKHWRECLYDPITERKYGGGGDVERIKNETQSNKGW